MTRDTIINLTFIEKKLQMKIFLQRKLSLDLYQSYANSENIKYEAIIKKTQINKNKLFKSAKS